MGNRLRGAVIGIVTLVWAMNFTAPIFVNEYKPSPELNVAFMAIIGLLTASQRLDKQRGGEPKAQPEPTTQEEPAAEEEQSA